MKRKFPLPGVLVAVMAAVALAAYPRTFYPEVRTLESRADTLVLAVDGRDGSEGTYAVEVRCAMPSAAQGRRTEASWRLSWANGVELELRFDFRGHRDGADIPEATVVLRPGDGREPLSARVSSGLDFRGGGNSLALEWSDGVGNVFVGNNRLSGVISTAMPMPQGDCTVSASDRASVIDAAVEIVADKRPPVAYDAAMLSPEAFAGSTSPEGVWVYLDRDTDESYAKPGGNYRLAIVADGVGGYDIVYLGGAVTNAAAWKPGMVKGKVHDLGFTDQFGLEWTDAMFEPMGSECWLNRLSADVISVNFPLHSASMRFRRVSAAR